MRGKDMFQSDDKHCFSPALVSESFMIDKRFVCLYFYSLLSFVEACDR